MSDQANSEIEVAQQSWAKAPDKHVEDAIHNIHDYNPQVRDIIISEANKRFGQRLDIDFSSDEPLVETENTSSFSKFVACVSFLAIYLLINLGLYGFYEAYDYFMVTKPIEQLKQEMSAIEDSRTLISLNVNRVELERKLGNIPQDEEASYDYILKNFTENELLYLSKDSIYVNAYNEKVDAYNSRIKKTIRRFYIIPIPRAKR